MKTDTHAPTFFGNPNVLTPQDVLTNSVDHQHILDMYPDGMGGVARFHVDRTIGWFVEEKKDGTFWAISGNADDIFETLGDAVEFLRENGGASEFLYALERRKA